MFREVRNPAARVRSVCQYGCQVEVDSMIPPKRYFRSGQEMIRMANVYFDEGDLESAFVLYSKFVTLFVEKLPKHPEYSDATNNEKLKTKQTVTKVFPLAEAIKDKLKVRYEKEETTRQEEERLLQERMTADELKRREEEEQFRRKNAAEIDTAFSEKFSEEQMMILEQERELEYLKEKERERVEAERRRQIQSDSDIAASLAGTVVVNTSIPDRPPPAYADVYPGPQVPDRNTKPSLSSSSLPSVDRSTKPSHFTATGGSTQNQYNLRSVITPADLPERFLAIAATNTQHNVETCGILSGKVSQNSFSVTHLLIPSQSGTSDTCATQNEEAIFEYQDSHSLITLGWIHTHPSQTAFLSSVDLHTHCSYQQLLPEAIAIVCSPKYNETGYYILTPHHGLSLISGCRKRGFHEHPKHPPLFEDASHVQVEGSSRIQVVDLRK